METIEQVNDGLEGVLAFATEIAEPDRTGGSLRYRGVDIEQLVGEVPFERVWGLLVADDENRPLEPVGPAPLALQTGDARADVQAAVAALAPLWNLRPLVDLEPGQALDDLARASAAVLSYTAQSARAAHVRPGTGPGAGARPARAALPLATLAEADTLAERFLLEWRGEVDPGHAAAIDAYWVTAAEHGMNASTFTARVIASTGADVGAALSGAIGALSGPLHGGAPARVLQMLDAVEQDGDADRYVRTALDRGERLMGFGHRVYRAEDPRARALRRIATELGAPRLAVAQALEHAALVALHERKPDRVLATNVEFWSAVLLDHARVPQQLFTPLFACARTAGWSAHVLEQRRSGRLIRPASLYVGSGPRALATRG